MHVHEHGCPVLPAKDEDSPVPHYSSNVKRMVCPQVARIGIEATKIGDMEGGSTSKDMRIYTYKP